MGRNEFALAGAALIIVMSAFAIALALAGSPVKDWASWAEAVGTTGAVVAALWTASRAIAFERDRNRARALVCAHFLAPHIIYLNNWSKAALMWGTRYGFGVTERFNVGFPKEVLEKLLLDREIPDIAFNDAWALPAEVAAACVLTGATVDQVRDVAKKHIPNLDTYDTQQNAAYVRMMGTAIRNLEQASDAARKGLESVIGTSLGSGRFEWPSGAKPPTSP